MPVPAPAPMIGFAPRHHGVEFLQQGLAFKARHCELNPALCSALAKSYCHCSFGLTQVSIIHTRDLAEIGVTH